MVMGTKVQIVNSINSDLSDQTKGSRLRSIIFFSFFYVYFWRYIQLHLVFHVVGNYSSFPVFFKGWSFFNSFTTSPGGLMEYAASFLAQLFYFSSAGAAVVTIIALLFCIATDIIVRSFNAPVLRPLRFAPAILILVIYSQGSHHIVITFALLIALLFVCLHIRITKQSSLYYAILLIESTLLYYLAGGAFFVFIIICVFYELFVTRKSSRAAACLVAAIAVPLIVGVIVCEIPPDQAVTSLTPFYRKTFALDFNAVPYAVYTMFFLLPAAALTVGLYGLLNKTHRKKITVSRKIPASITWSLRTLPLIVITVVAIFYFTDKQRKSAYRLDYYLNRQMWSQMHQTAMQNPNTLISICYADLAMSQAGRLGYDLFKWHKTPETQKALFLNIPGSEETYWAQAEVFLHVGLINYAQVQMVMSMDQYGKRPAILQRLAFVHMIKGDNDGAKVFLNALKKTLFHNGTAEEYLAAIAADPSLSQMEEIQYYRSLINDDRVFFLNEGPTPIIQEQIVDNPNRPAFEYMMSRHLLMRRTDELVKNIPQFKKLGYLQIPRLYEEAIIVHELITGKAQDLDGYTISDETLGNYKKFNDIKARYGKNAQARIAEYEKSIGDSYLLYHYKNNRR